MRKKLELTEREILRQVRDYLRVKGWFVYRNHQSLGSHKGLADLTAIKGSHAIWIEIKKSKAELSKHQELFANDIREHGGLYLTIHSLEEIMEWVK